MRYRIKDDVDLKTLKNYGFVYNGFMGYRLLGEKLNDNWAELLATVSNPKRRDLWIKPGLEIMILNKLGDIVEEMEEDSNE